MRIAVGGFMQETNSFSPVNTTLANFESEYLLRGDELISQFRDANSEIGGFLAACRSEPSVEVVPLMAATANSGGPLTAQTFALLRGELMERLQAARAVGEVDGVLLALHGSMGAESEDDPEAAVLQDARRIAGEECLIAASLDLHANVTERMAAAADILVGYRTYPHVDQRLTGERAAGPLFAALRGGPRPVTAVVKIPLLTPAEYMQTTRGPMHALRSEADRLEAAGEALKVSVFAVQPWLDVPDAGCSVVVVDVDVEAARTTARRLARDFWRRRREFDVELVDADLAVQRALRGSGAPVILVDSADCPSSGAPGDSTAVLAALLKAGLGEAGGREAAGLCLVPLVDAEAAALCHGRGAGAEVNLAVGGKLDPGRSRPVRIAGRVERLTDGRFVRKGPGFTGLRLDAGPSAVIAMGDLRLLTVTRAVPMNDPELYRAAGLRPESARMVVVKSPNQFRAAYEGIAGETILLDTPGAASANLRSFPWRRVRRPLYPLDDFEWDG